MSSGTDEANAIQVVLVDEIGREVGLLGKRQAHEHPGHLHKAVSILGFDEKFERVLLQRRAREKSMFAGYWSNSACTHPLEGEAIIEAAVRRCREEISAHLARPTRIGSFTYRAEEPASGLVEYELDDVVVGVITEFGKPNPDEVSDTCWVRFEDLIADPDAIVEPLAPWFSTVCLLASVWLESLDMTARK